MRGMKLVPVLCVALIVISGLCLSGATQGKEKIEIRFYSYASDPILRAHEKMGNLFQKQNPNIKITPTVLSQLAAAGGAEEGIIPAIAAGERPDIVFLHTLRTYEFARFGLLVPVSKRWPDEFEAAMEPRYDQLKKNWLRDNNGIGYGLPIVVDAHSPAYNKDMAREVGLNAENPPTTWGEFLKWCEKLTRDRNGDGQIDLWAVDLLQYTPWALMLYLDAYPAMYTDRGPTLLDQKNGQFYSVADTPPVIKTVKLLKELHDNGYAIPERPPQGVNFFYGQKVAIAFFEGVRGYAFAAQQIGNKFEWAPMRYPLPPGAKSEEPLIVGGGDGVTLSIFNVSKHIRESWDFVKFVGTKTGERCYGEIAYPPARKDMAEDPYLEEIPESFRSQYKKVLSFIEGYAHPRDGREYTRMERALQDEYEKVLYADKDVESAMKDAAEKINEILEQTIGI